MMTELGAGYGNRLREYVSPVSENYRAYFVDEGPNSLVFLPNDGVVKAGLIGPTDPLQRLIGHGEVDC
ncbi:hypothetical protein [Phytohabitans aurantiacus]|jgi:hypothetical protein|uniref:Uncharacterized protein n=1 Tax=Phytohabitans aurantiacus TaxID=3016789 RepID=A0ABQ5R829_9ACTN|nr:hypothetical protein [Phytohabitans aurantiacus]GLI02927.1 hypothetical protein Pa4123_82050 [Phytohabitans aurantiacus]